MTGAVFVIFAAATLWALDPNLVVPVAKLPYDWPEAMVAFAIVGFPIIGITIQGFYYVAYTLGFRRAWFGDPARTLVSRTVTRAIAACLDRTQIDEKDWKFIRSAPDDAFFVWLYHDRATPHMIEWARRRRSYSYLGANWSLAAIAGFAAALLYRAIHGNADAEKWILVVLGIIWVGCAYWAGDRMRRDADTMEAIWSASQTDPAFRECVCRLLPHEASGVREETLSRQSRPPVPSGKERAGEVSPAGSSPPWKW